MVKFKYIFFILIIVKSSYSQDYLLPIDCLDRTDISLIELTEIGNFGELRKARPGIPEHFHTGIDIKRPKPNFTNEPIYAITEGIVMSVRTDGPYALIIIEHNNNENIFWTEYEHIAGIEVKVGDNVNENTRIARFMNLEELNKYGWQFDHFHFEILKMHPKKLNPTNKQPQYIFGTYNLICYTLDTLNNKYYNPISFLDKFLHKR